jgi:hypothetical protein
MNYDDMFKRGLWGSGPLLELRKIIAEYRVDGIRLGGIDFVSKSGSANQPSLSKRRAEIESAAFLLARLGYKEIGLVTLDEARKDLESPDLDALLPEGRIGVEVAEVTATQARLKEASVERIGFELLDLRDADPSFTEALGQHYVIVTLHGPLGDASAIQKPEMFKILKELERFIRNQDHIQESDELTAFPDKYQALHARGATFSTAKMSEGSISVGRGSEFVSLAPETQEVLRVLNRHRKSASGYRPLPTWLVLFLSDSNEVFRNTIGEIEAHPPSIDPFVRCYLSDVAGRLLQLPMA